MITNKDYPFRRSRWLWLLALLMLVPIGSWAQSDTDYELVIEMRDGSKQFARIINDYPLIKKTVIADGETGKTSVVLMVEKSSTPGDRFEVLYDGILKLYTQVATSVIIKANSYIITEGDPIPSFEYTTEGVELVGTPELTCEATPESAPGDYPIVVSRGTVTNENVQFVNGTLTILPETTPITSISVIANDCTMEYGDQVPVLTYKVEGGSIEGAPELTCDATSTSIAGTYPISISAGSITTSDIQFIPGTLTINKAPLTIKGKSYTIGQYEDLPEDYEMEYSGFKNDDTPSILSNQPHTEAIDETRWVQLSNSSTAGEFAIKVYGSDDFRYDVTCVDGKLTITEAPAVTLTAKNYTIKYRDTTPTLEYTIEGGKIYGEPSIYIQGYYDGADAGVYDIVLDRNTILNEKLTLVNGQLTVKKVPLTITAKNYTITQGEWLPTFECDYEGFLEGDTQFNSLWPWPTLTTTATSESPAGVYPIQVSGAESRNYELTYVNGTLTILDPTAIIKLLTSNEPFDIYTSAGTLCVKNASSIDSLPKGVYILKLQNGKTLKLTRK